MDLLHFFYHIFSFLVSLSTLFFAVYALRYRSLRVAQLFSWLMLAATGWLWSDLARAICQNPQAAYFLESKVQYVFIAAMPVLFLLFILDYMGHEKRISSKTVILLFIIPAITQIVNWGEISGGVEKDIVFDRAGAFLYSIGWTYTPWFWVHMTYCYALLFIATSMIVVNLIQSSQAYRYQIMLLLIGSLMPPLAVLLDTFAIVRGPMDVGPIGFALMGPFFMWALFRYHLLDLIPVARSKLVETMDDPMMVIDTRGRVVDLNQAARKIINIADKKVIGEPISEVLSPWQDLVHSYRNANRVQKEISVEVNQVSRSYDLHISPLTDRQARITGRLIVLRDITARKAAEQERERLITELQKALSDVKVLSGLLPICASCKKIRDDKGYWNQLEAYIHQHSDVKFSHGICPECAQTLYKDFYTEFAK